jgi:hypothetical protein
MASGSKTRTTQTFLKCDCCGNVNPIFRKKSKQRDKGHLKHMYCYKCKEIKAHLEVKEDAFLPEWLKSDNQPLEM